MRIGWNTGNPPEEREEYLVQYKSGGMDICRWSNVNPFWPQLTSNWRWVDLAQFAEVVAWMPLPEPYKEEGE